MAYDTRGNSTWETPLPSGNVRVTRLLDAPFVRIQVVSCPGRVFPGPQVPIETIPELIRMLGEALLDAPCHLQDRRRQYLKSHVTNSKTTQDVPD